MRREANSLRFGWLGWVVSCDGEHKCINVLRCGVRKRIRTGFIMCAFTFVCVCVQMGNQV